VTDEASLLRAIEGAPEDDAPRMVYADWLMTRGDPRGEFIQLQCTLYRTRAGSVRFASIRDRAQALLDRHASRWAPIANPRLVWAFERGFACGFGHGGVFHGRSAEASSMSSWVRWWPDGLGLWISTGSGSSADQVATWFERGHRHSLPFSYVLKLERGRVVLAASGKARGKPVTFDAVLDGDGLRMSTLEKLDRRFEGGTLHHELEGRRADSRAPTKPNLGHRARLMCAD